MTLIVLIFDIVSWVCLVGGSLFAVVGGIGIIRLPDFYARLHGGGITDTLGAGLVVMGLTLQALKVGVQQLIEHGLADGLEPGPWLIAVKLVMILFFLLISSPSSCHALAQSAFTRGVEPVVSENQNEPTN